MLYYLVLVRERCCYGYVPLRAGVVRMGADVLMNAYMPYILQ